MGLKIGWREAEEGVTDGRAKMHDVTDIMCPARGVAAARQVATLHVRDFVRVGHARAAHCTCLSYPYK